MDSEQPYHSGILLLPPMGKLVIKKTWQQKYVELYKASKFGLERLEVHESVENSKFDQPKIITLENCIKISAKSSTYFTLITKSGSYEFGAKTEESMNDWLSALQSVAFPDNASKITSIEEDNDLYCSSGEGVFNVKLHHSAASSNCGLEADKFYTLVLTSRAIELRNCADNRLLFTWPYCYIRRYGYKSGKFTFEAGRKCDSGEGIFYLEHSNQKEIFRYLATKLKSMKKNIGNLESYSIEEDIWHAANTMEAKSRSPIPPSANSSTSNISMIEKEMTVGSKLSYSNSDSESNSSKKSTPPFKPPRKFVGSKFLYEPVDKYDHIEYRNNAWQTLGVDDVKHTEQYNQDDEDEYTSWGFVKHQIKKIETTIPSAPKILPHKAHSVDEDNSYDKLNFFGSSSKLNANSGYKQVIPAPVVPVNVTPSFNEYDEVEPWRGSDIRLADDSHLGYAVVRKEPPVENVKSDRNERVNHQLYNDEPYAVISKPKRV